jgi:hypothetical protein
VVWQSNKVELSMPESTGHKKTQQDLPQPQEAASWIRSMIDHYQQTGTYRQEDLRRLLGDPTQVVEVTPCVNMTELFTPCKKP